MENNIFRDIEFPSLDKPHNEYCDNHNQVIVCKCIEIMDQGEFHDRIIPVTDYSIDNNLKPINQSFHAIQEGYPFNNPVPEYVWSDDDIEERIKSYRKFLEKDNTNTMASTEKYIDHMVKQLRFSGTEECWKEWIEEYFNHGKLTYPETDYNDDYFIKQEQYCRELLAEKRINVTEQQIQDYIDYLYELTGYSKPGDKNVL